MSTELVTKIRDSVIGDGQLIETSFGQKPLIYADYTASGRSLDFIEQFITNRVLPFYANTHTETSFTGAQSTAFREEARQSIKLAVNAVEDDQLIFCGSGATAAINKLIDILNLRLPADLNERHRFLDLVPAASRPVVFIGPYEHHSNEIPWRESIADVVVIPLSESGQLDTKVLHAKLIEFADRSLKIGSFSAASNVTGLKTDVDEVAALLHQFDALSFWDYAAAAPYVSIDMNPLNSACSKDAVFLSPHKFVGGPGTPGVLIVKKKLLTNSVPASPGGGTVLYVTPIDHQFIADHERREEGGTPAIVESVRAGLVFKLQQAVGTDLIESLEASFKERALARWKSNKNIEILGDPSQEGLSIFSLRIKHGEADLHYGFVVALLNDLFGIQARGGCSCAGPYGHELLGMDLDYSRKLEKELNKGHMVMRPGWVRLNFNYFINEETFDYLLKAIEYVSLHGWKLLPFYQFDADSGTWRYQGTKMKFDTLCLESLFTEAQQPTMVSEKPLSEYLDEALNELNRIDESRVRYSLPLPESANKLRWFVLPQEIESESRIGLAS
jgi:selenocysteine lyase/cysteine desulfurase